MEMALFQFGECEMCKQNCNSAKLSLHQFLPANVCEKISEYNNPCECKRIKMLREKENKFMKEKMSKNLTIGEKQILFFLKYMDTPITPNNGYGGMCQAEEQQMKNEIDAIYEKLKGEYANFNMKMRRLAIKSFMKKNLPLVLQIINSCYWSDLLSDNARLFCLLVATDLSLEIKNLTEES